MKVGQLIVSGIFAICLGLAFWMIEQHKRLMSSGILLPATSVQFS